MYRGFVRLFTLIALASIIFAPLSASAQDQNPPRGQAPTAGQRENRPPQAQRQLVSSDDLENNTPEGDSWRSKHAYLSPSATGGPDVYGYTWDDSVPYSWVNATDGTDTGLGGYDEVTAQIPLPFPFKFYENTYDTLAISKNGFVGFNQYMWGDQTEIPTPGRPNNIIAPYLAPLAVDEYGYDGGVYYKTGGVAPDRYLVVEWYQARDDYSPGSNIFTFEVLLYENGQIVFQYNTMTYAASYWCGHAGIEDAEGLDGLAYGSFCQNYPSSKAVRFYRPAAAARVKMTPRNQGQFIRGLEPSTFQVNVRNTGELGADTFDLFLSTTWPVNLYQSDGVTPLTDTDGDGMMDTGILAQDASVGVIAKVQTPAYANIGDNNAASVTARSSLNLSKQHTAAFKSAVPAPFAQVFGDYNDGALSQYLVKPSQQTLLKATANDTYPWNLGTAEGPDRRLVSVWNESRCVDQNCNLYVYEVWFTLLDHSGATLRAPTRVVDLSSVTYDTYDYQPAVAFSPDGHIGLTWYRYEYNTSNNQYRYNIWYAILDSNGNITSGPTNLTNNNTWASGSGYGVARFWDPAITATLDNRFVLAWTRYVRNSSASENYLYDIYYAIRNTSGTQVKAVTKFSDSATNNRWYWSPDLAWLSGNRVFLSYHKDITGTNNDPVVYAVLDSAGNTVKGATTIGTPGWTPDAVQLTNGNILLAWENDWITYAILDWSTYNPIYGPSFLVNSDRLWYDEYVSVSADGMGHGILTWQDGSYRNLYYAAVSTNGSLITQPMIYRNAQVISRGDYYELESSFNGQGNTSYSEYASTGGVDLSLQAPAWVGAPAGGTANIPISFGNNGQTTAFPVVITATLNISLTYQGDTLGIPPTINGPVVSWVLPTGLGFLGTGKFALTVGVPAASLGSQYPVSLQIGSGSPEAYPSDNAAPVLVNVSSQVFIPVSLR